MKKLKTILMIALVFLMAGSSVYAAEVEIRSDKGSGKILSTKLDDETVRIDVTTQLLNDKDPIANEYVTIAMYGPTKPTGTCFEKEIGGKAHYSYYIDQVRTDSNGEVDFSFTVEIPEEETCYLIFSGNNVETPFELNVLLPPAESQVVPPMDRPSRPGGGGSGGGGGNTSTPVAIPGYPSDQTETDNPGNEPEVIFTDITADHWAYNDCINLYRRGIVTGDGDGSLRPSDNISREEIVVVLTKAFQISTPETDILIDDTTSDWARNYIAAAVKAGIMMEDANGTYRGTSNATRAEAVTMINRCLNLEGNAEVLAGFLDVSAIPDYSVASFSALVEREVINGYEDNTIRPENPISRAELFKIISRVLEEVL